MSNPNSKEEEFFIPIKKHPLTPERLFKHRDSETEPIIIPTKNKNRSLSAPTIPENVRGIIATKKKYESEKDLQRAATIEERQNTIKALSSDALNKYAFPTLDTNQPTESKMGQPTNLEKQKKRQARLLRSDNRRISALTELMDQKEENEEMSAEDKKGGKTRKSTKSKKRRTKKKRPQFLYNPNDPKKSFDVYIDKNPDDTITIKYTTVDDVKNTIQKLEKLYKNNKYSHKRIWQVGMILKVRLEAILNNKHLYPNAKNVKSRYDLSNKYFKFLGKRSQEKDDNKRKKMTFKS
tara:strand:- start:5799 stop:6680 length:882 start_codon:yes stop_codon:yes gene_type:complete